MKRNRDLSSLFGGMTGGAAKALKGRKSRLDAAIEGKPSRKRKTTKKKATKKKSY